MSRIAWCLKSERLTGNSNIWVRLEWTNRFGVSDIYLCPTLVLHLQSLYELQLVKMSKKYVQCVLNVLIFLQEKTPYYILHKFRYCEKAKKNEKISHLFLKLLSNVKIMWEIFSNFCGLLRIS